MGIWTRKQGSYQIIIFKNGCDVIYDVFAHGSIDYSLIPNGFFARGISIYIFMLYTKWSYFWKEYTLVPLYTKKAIEEKKTVFHIIEEKSSLVP